MTSRSNYLEFAPPQPPGLLRAAVLATLAHLILLAILSEGVQWKSEVAQDSAQAELWSAIPMEAAAPAPPAQPAPEPEVKPPPAPEVSPVKSEAEASIALEKGKTAAAAEKKRKDKETPKTTQELDENQLWEQEKRRRAAAEKAAQQQALKQEKEDAKRQEELRQQNLQRMATLAGSGGVGEVGASAQASGPSAGYAGRIRARIKPNITFTDIIDGNPTAEIEVRTSPDGTIISRRLTRASGVKAWDDAVLNAIDKTEVLPKDVDGRVPNALVISFRPKD